MVPYLIMSLTVATPMLFMDMTLGQYSGRGPTQVFGRLSPAMRGLGYTMVALTFFFAIYYNVIIAYAIHYLFAGMAPQLPWSAGPPDLTAAETNPRPKWAATTNATDPTCCYEQVLKAFKDESSLSRVRVTELTNDRIFNNVFIYLSISGGFSSTLELTRVSRVWERIPGHGRPGQTRQRDLKPLQVYDSLLL